MAWQESPDPRGVGVLNNDEGGGTLQNHTWIFAVEGKRIRWCAKILMSSGLDRGSTMTAVCSGVSMPGTPVMSPVRFDSRSVRWSALSGTSGAGCTRNRPRWRVCGSRLAIQIELVLRLWEAAMRQPWNRYASPRCPYWRWDWPKRLSSPTGTATRARLWALGRSHDRTWTGSGGREAWGEARDGAWGPWGVGRGWAQNGGYVGASHARAPASDNRCGPL